MPADDKPTSLVVFYHGGGWVIGSIDECEFIARFMIQKSNCAALLVDYRLAPEHPYPTPLDDCWDGLVFAAKEAEKLNVPIVVAGDSAGGNLATVCAMLARDRGGPAIALQILLYPVCDCDMETKSYRAMGRGLVLTSADMGWFYDHYLQGDKAKRGDPLISPLRALELKGLPPALIMTAEYNVLRDEAEIYGKRLAAAGVKTWIKRYRGMTHGFIRLQNFVDVARAGMDDIATAMAATRGAKAVSANGTEDEFDYIIVGAGSSGCVIANRLTADPNTRVLLLEAGPRDNSIFIRMPAGNTRRSFPPSAPSNTPANPIPT